MEQDKQQHTEPGAPSGDDFNAQGAEQAQQAAQNLGSEAAEAADAEQNKPGTDDTAGDEDEDPSASRIQGLETALEERTNDLKRLQAEYVNYKRRVDRDRAQARGAGVEAVVVDLLPMLDSLQTARQHEELSGGFKLLATELEKVAAKHGLESFGKPGEPFDPQIHEALMQAPQPGSGEPALLEVMQAGYRLKGRVLRPARVAVGMPTGEEPAVEQTPSEG